MTPSSSPGGEPRQREEPINQKSGDDEDVDYEVARVTLYDDAESGPVAVTVPAKPVDQLRKLTLIGLFGLIILSLILIWLGQIWDWFGEDFAKTLIQTVVSPVLGALTAIIGYLFAERKGDR